LTERRDKPKAILAWSSGKDSAYALHRVREQGRLEVTALLTTVTDDYSRVSMHGVREEILDLQAERAGLPLIKVRIPAPCPNEVYEKAMAEALAPLPGRGVRQVVFGDLFLADLRAWREERLAGVGMEGVFPLWGEETGALARRMIADGVRAHVVCLDPAKVDPMLAGHAFDEAFLRQLDGTVDPCGENGEFHTLVSGGPCFDRAFDLKPAQRVEREGFVFADFYLNSEHVLGDKGAAFG